MNEAAKNKLKKQLYSQYNTSHAWSFSLINNILEEYNVVRFCQKRRI